MFQIKGLEMILTENVTGFHLKIDQVDFKFFLKKETLAKRQVILDKQKEKRKELRELRQNQFIGDQSISMILPLSKILGKEIRAKRPKEPHYDTSICKNWVILRYYTDWTMLQKKYCDICKIWG